MRDITHSVLARKAALKLKRPLFTTKKFIASLAIALGIAGLGFGSLASATASVPWTGQGTTNGALDTVECSASNTSYLLWVFTLGGGSEKVTSANLLLGGSDNGSYSMKKTGHEMKATTPYFDLNTLSASVSYVGTLGRGAANLVISHGCPGATAKVTLTKTFEQGVFTALPASGDACFTLTTNTGTSDTTQCTNTPEWDGLTTGSYTVSESTTPSGYDTITDISFTVADDCIGVTGTCVETGNSVAASVGTPEDMLLPGHLQVLKQLGPRSTTWTGPNVTFYICAHDPLSSTAALTSTDCNSSSKTDTLIFPQNGTTAISSGDLAEGYYTVCEGLVSGYTADHQCQEATVTAGDTGTISSLTFVNTPVLYWCSPGFWAQNQDTLAGTSYDPAPYLDDLVPGTSYTVGYALANPNVVGGPVFNKAADYLAAQFGWLGTSQTGDNCPIDAHGNPTVAALTL